MKYDMVNRNKKKELRNMSKYVEMDNASLRQKIQEYKELIWRVGPGSERTIEAVQEIQGMEKRVKKHAMQNLKLRIGKLLLGK